MEGKNKNKMWIILGSSFAVLLITCLVGLIFTGMYVGWGPFAFMQFDHEEKSSFKNMILKQGRGDRFLRRLQLPTLDGDGKRSFGVQSAEPRFWR